VALVREEGKSAKDTTRPGLQRLLAELPERRRGWDALVVTKLDRLTRSVRDLGELTAAFLRSKVAFVSLDESVDTGSAAGELFLNAVASISQWERRAIGERTASAMAHLRRQGRRVSRHIEYGYQLAADGLTLVEDADEQRVLGLIRQLGRTCSTRELARRLAEQGITGRGQALRVLYPVRSAPPSCP
jgi:site-specific DNA recombinase